MILSVTFMAVDTTNPYFCLSIYIEISIILALYLLSHVKKINGLQGFVFEYHAFVQLFIGIESEMRVLCQYVMF